MILSYLIGDQSILEDTGLRSMKDVHDLPVPPEGKDKVNYQKYTGEVSYFICTRSGQGPMLLAGEDQALLNPQTGFPK